MNVLQGLPQNTPESVQKQSVPQQSVQQQIPQKRVLPPSIPKGIENEPKFEIPSKDAEYELFASLIDILTGTYDFSKGKKVMVRTKGAPAKVERTAELQNAEKAELENAKAQIFTQYENLLSVLGDFVQKNLGDGNLKISDKKIEITFPKGKASKADKDQPKKEPIVFDQFNLVEEFKKTQSTLFKFIAKDFLSNDFMNVITSGILSSRSIIKSSQFCNIKGIDKLGIMSQININICNDLPTSRFNLPEDGKCDCLDDYYWLVLNSKPKTNPSEIFERRQGLIRHQRFHEIDISKLWTEARERIKSNTSDTGFVWNEILNSPFMFKIICQGFEMNPLILPCFKKFINLPESISLFRNELLPISMFFTCLNLGPINKDLDESRTTVWELYDYLEFSFVRKIIKPETKCVIDINSEPVQKTETETETTN